MKLALTNLFCTALLLFLSIAGFSQASSGAQIPDSRTAGDISLVSINYPCMALVNGVYQNDGYYSTRAANQIIPIALSGNILNSGTTDQTNVRLLAQVTESLGTIFFDGADSISELLVGDDTLIEIADYFTPNGIGDFTLSMWCDQAEGDIFPKGNYTDDVNININDNHVIARYKDYNNSICPFEYNLTADNSFIGMFFHVAQNDKIHSISVFIDSLSDTGTLCKLTLLKYITGFDRKAESIEYIIQSSDLGKWLNLELTPINPEDIYLETGTRYLAGIEFLSLTEAFKIGSDTLGKHDYGKELLSIGYGWVFFEETPLIEVHLDGYVHNIDETQKSTSLLYPNPASSSVNIESEFVMNKLEIYNISGELLQSVAVASNKQEIDISTFSTGTYFVKVLGKGELAFGRFIKL